MIKKSIKTDTYSISIWTLCALSVALLPSIADAQTISGETIYKQACMTCHDSGAGHAPRVSVRDEWRPRWQRGRETMYEAAIKGVPNTAMVAKGGFANLSDAEVKAAVDFILARTGFQQNLVVKSAAPAVTVVAPSANAAPVDDNTLMKQIAEALRKSIGSPNAQIETVGSELIVRGINIKIIARDGVVTLMGVMEKADMIARAEQIAKSVGGVRRVENRLVSGGMLDFD